MVKDTDLAWLAGIVDGEGCIYGHWSNRGRHSTGGNVSVEIRIEATSSRMITRAAEICDALGIPISIDIGRLRKTSTKSSNRLNIRKRVAVVAFLRAILPYLQVKDHEAMACISWYEKWGDQRGIGKLTASHDEKITLFESLRQMKRTA